MADEIKTKKASKSEQEKKEIVRKAKKTGIRVERPKPQKSKKEKTKPQKTVNEKRKINGVYYDYTLLFMIIFLLVFGLIMIYSSSSYTAGLKFKDSAYFVKRQIGFIGLGFVGMIITTFIPYKWFIKVSKYLYGFSIFLSIIVLFIGKEVNGAKRWIVIGPINFQPSETVKISLIIFLAYYLVKHKDDLFSTELKIVEKRLLRIFFLVIIPVLLVAKENLSTAIIIFLIAYCMSYMGTIDRRVYVIATMLMGVALLTSKYVVRFLYSKGLRDYHVMRFLVWAEPEKFSRDGGYQVIQGLYAVGSGGIFGKGLGQGMQKFFIPEAQNDMIFSIIVEEFGLVGVIMILAVFTFIIRRMIIIAFSITDLEARYIVVGVIVHLSLQVILNIAVVTGVLPNTGVSLPFISYGGSSISILLVEIGMVYSVARTIKME